MAQQAVQPRGPGRFPQQGGHQGRIIGGFVEGQAAGGGRPAIWKQRDFGPAPGVTGGPRLAPQAGRQGRRQIHADARTEVAGLDRPRVAFQQQRPPARALDQEIEPEKARGAGCGDEAFGHGLHLGIRTDADGAARARGREGGEGMAAEGREQAPLPGHRGHHRRCAVDGLLHHHGAVGGIPVPAKQAAREGAQRRPARPEGGHGRVDVLGRPAGARTPSPAQPKDAFT